MTASIGAPSQAAVGIGHRRHPIVAAPRELLFIPAIPTIVSREFEALLDWRPDRA